MNSYIKNILLTRILGFIFLGVGFYIYLSNTILTERYLAYAFSIMSDSKTLSYQYNLFDRIPEFGGEYGLSSTIFYMQNIVTLYFIAIYGVEAIWKENRDYILGKLFIGIVLFRFAIIPNFIPLSFIMCVIIYTLLVNGITYALKNYDEEEKSG